MKMKSNLIPFVLCLILTATTLSCGLGGRGPKILVDKEVTVPSGGNTAEVVFNAEEGQRIRISLEAKDSAVEPYGYLTYPDSDGDYYPKIENVQDGKNIAEFTLNQSGDYTLAVMDGSNQGGLVKVKVEILD